MSAALNAKNVQVKAQLCGRITSQSSGNENICIDINGKYQLSGEYCIEDNECGRKSTLKWEQDEQTVNFLETDAGLNAADEGKIYESDLTPPTSGLKLETEVDVFGMKVGVAFGGKSDDANNNRMASNYLSFSQQLNAGNHASIKFRNLNRFEAELSANLSGVAGSLVYERSASNGEQLTLTSEVDGLGFSVVKDLTDVDKDGDVGISKYVLSYEAGNCRGKIEYAPDGTSSNAASKLSGKVECDAECGDKWIVELDQNNGVEICYERVFRLC